MDSTSVIVVSIPNKKKKCGGDFKGKNKINYIITITIRILNII